MMLGSRDAVTARIGEAERLRLFLDYDGTLADFAPTPEHVNPNPDVIALVSQLAEHSHIRPTVISGRRLEHVRKLVPVSGVMLAGTYGIELQMPNGERLNRVPYQDVRPVLDAIKPRWEKLIAHRKGYFLEDKGWSLALHARYADDAEAESVVTQARQAAEEVLEDTPSELFRLLGGHKFMEVGPTLAHKGKTVELLLDRYPWPGALPLYVGDDDKDEEAFSVIHAREGLAIRVCEYACDTIADGRLVSPADVRSWLHSLLGSLD